MLTLLRNAIMRPKRAATRELDMRVAIMTPIPGPEMHMIGLENGFNRVSLVGLFRPHCRVQRVIGASNDEPHLRSLDGVSWKPSVPAFLGLMMSKDGIIIDSVKIEVIHDWDMPTSLTKLSTQFFNVLLVHRYVSNESHVLQYDAIELDDCLTFGEELVAILARDLPKLHSRAIVVV
ncbi:hypothetical protein MTR67_001382 [Solanum verrucosum]|uniref:Uncharacterized protein n=1 Tax=Solanum verrucosum TaxID=315347 RepID=A0AAF0PP67_SOLVR|nr:hypothetical protein MTR67_001382 [Solanum verrucosum]